MKLQELELLKEVLQKDYPASKRDIEMVFIKIFKQFIEEKTLAICLNRDFTIETRFSTKRGNIRPSYYCPEFKSMEPSIFHERMGIHTLTATKKKKYDLIDNKEPLIYLEEE